jgi:hypothetical protein
MRRAGIALLLASIATVLWTTVIWLSGGFVLSVAGFRISSSEPRRPLLVAALFAGCYAALAGPAQLRRDAEGLKRRLTAARVTALLIIIVLIVGLAHNAWTAGGSDAYSYISQADLWLEGKLKTEIPLAGRVPWPNGLATFTPFGYRPVPNEPAIAPMTGPGLPLMMAALKSVAGHTAAFLVVPFSGALFLWATFLIGRRLVSESVGLGGAWLVATSPTFLIMFKSQMSDVPAGAFWALATYWTLGNSARSAIAAGLAASTATLIRPNLVPVAVILCLWLARYSNRRRLFAFVVGALPGSVIVAAINNHLYGSPLSSGYGELGDLFSIANVPNTLTHYGTWLIETQTPVALAGVIALAVAPRPIWRTPQARARVRLLASVVIVVWALYSVYQLFNVWWSLRFLLPTWPAMCVGVAALVMWPAHRMNVWRRALQVSALIALGLYGLVVTSQRGVFPEGEGERRYASIAMLVEQHTEADAMILASIHAGATRYYAGRATMRFDLLDEAWLDRAVEWLQQNGRHPYVLIEDWEMPAFTKRFSGANRLGALTFAPALAYQAYRIPGRVYLFDLLRLNGPTLEPLPVRSPLPLCVPPGPRPPLA